MGEQSVEKEKSGWGGNVLVVCGFMEETVISSDSEIVFGVVLCTGVGGLPRANGGGGNHSGGINIKKWDRTEAFMNLSNLFPDKID